jgi:hypothetical protein
MNLKRPLTALFALSVAVSSPALATEKQQVSLTKYWELQKELGKPLAHIKYTPFPRQIISIPVQSTKHGPITIQFNTHTFMPAQKEDGTIALIPTTAVISAVHAGLGKLNNGDEASVKTAMNLLAQSPQIITPKELERITGDDHLDKVHGIDLFDIVDGKVKPGSQMLTIIQACQAELK